MMMPLRGTVITGFCTVWFCLLLGGCGVEPPSEQERVRPVKALKIADFAGMAGRTFPGRAKATQEVDLAFEVPGTLAKRPVNIGDTVDQGELIAQLDQRRFLAELKAAEAQVTKDKANFERAEELIKQDFISKTQYDELEARLAVAESNLDLAQKALADSVIEAPFAGVIANLFVDNYTAVKPKQPVARLLDASRIEFVVNIPEQFISLARRVHNLRVTFDAFADVEIPAEIKEIGSEATQATRTYPVTLIMDQPDGVRILPGMAGVATGAGVEEASGGTSVDVPVTAVFSPDGNGESYVWVIDENNMTVSRRPVVVESLANTGITLSEGLQPGEWIAIAGVHYLEEGQKVRILDGGGEG